MVLIIVGLAVWQAFRTWQTKMTTRLAIAQDEAYRRLAEEATAAQRQTATKLGELSDGLTDLRGRVAALEKLLSEVG